GAIFAKPQSNRKKLLGGFFWHSSDSPEVGLSRQLCINLRCLKLVGYVSEEQHLFKIDFFLHQKVSSLSLIINLMNPCRINVLISFLKKSYRV
uniref:Uncharacterized protein n=1 Tax=Cyprinus carpio TaxID=7962 RepID=A0A8C2HYN7_CYPCA